MNGPNQNTKGKILVIRGGAIGDFILTLPALAALRQQFPRTHLEVLGYPHIAQLAQAGGLADRVQSIEARALAGFFARNGSLDRTLAEYFAGFNLILSYLYDPDQIFQTNVACCSKAQFIAGPHRPNEADEIHASDVFLKPLERLAIFNPDPVPRWQFMAATSSTAGTLPESAASCCEPAASLTQSPARNWLALHPGSGSEKKNWPETRWADLLGRLGDAENLNVLLIGGEAEGDRLARLAARFPSERLRLAQSLPLVELAGRLAECQAFVGHDSGITHLAAAVGLPGLVLWAETNSAIWRPRNERMIVLREGRGLSELPMERVLQALQAIYVDAPNHRASR